MQVSCIAGRFFFKNLFILSIPEMASLVTEMGKYLPAMQETWVQSLGQEDPLEKGMATHSINLAGEFHG